MQTTETMTTLGKPSKACANLRVARTSTNGIAIIDWHKTVEVLDRKQARRLARELLKATGARTAGEAFGAALLEALARHLEKPVTMTDLEALCQVVGVRPSEIARRSETRRSA